MQHLTANIRGKIRKEILLGRSYWVAPVTMIVPGVLEGSAGKKLYTANETAKSEFLWNDIPLVLEHPKENGKFIAARNRPDVLSSYQIGRVYNVIMTTDGLEGEAWFDYKITKAKEPKIIANLKAGVNMELSVGVITEDTVAPANSKFKGVTYDSIAANLKPDHLAILMTKQGACSLKDGCGVHVNENGENINGNELSHDQVKTALRELLASGFTQDMPYFYICDVFDDYFVFEQGSKLYQASYEKTEAGVVLLDKAPVEVVREVSFSPVSTNQESDMSKKALIDDLVTNGCGCWTEEDRKTLEGMSEDRLTGLVANSKETKALQLTVNAANKVGKFDAKAKKFVVNATDPEQPEDVTDGSAEDEEEVSESQRTSKKGKAVTANHKDKQVTINEWMNDDSIPKEVRSAFKNANKLELREKKRIALALTANVAEDDKEAKVARLMKKDLEDLQEMEDLMPTTNSQQEEEDNEPSFFGSLLSTNARQAKSDPDDVLDTPSVDWSKSKSA